MSIVSGPVLREGIRSSSGRATMTQRAGHRAQSLRRPLLWAGSRQAAASASGRFTMRNGSAGRWPACTWQHPALCLVSAEWGGPVGWGACSQQADVPSVGAEQAGNSPPST